MLLSSCSSEKKTIRIGFVGGLTGSGSDLSVDAMYGAILAADTINASGGIMNKDVELVIKNDESNPQKALTAVQSLDQAGCGFIIGPMISSLVTTTVPYVNTHNVLMVSPTIALDDLSGIDDHFIRLIPTNTTQATLLSEAVANSQVQRLGVLVAQRNTLFAQAFINKLTQSNGPDVIDIIDTYFFDSGSELDYQSLISEFKDKQIDSLMIIASGDETAFFAQMFDLYSYHPVVFLPAWAMTNDLILRGGKGTEGFFGVNYVHADSSVPEYIDFKSRYLEAFGREPTFSAVMAYESVMLVAKAMASVSSTDPMRVKEEIVLNNRYKGVYGDLDIDRFGDATRTISLFQILDGKFVVVKP
jgi:branched-chain amino acid transport system substrate-binding protein